jgi:hypothetical protein
MTFSERDPEDLADCADDHLVDALRYGLVWQQIHSQRVRLPGL